MARRRAAKGFSVAPVRPWDRFRRDSGDGQGPVSLGQAGDRSVVAVAVTSRVTPRANRGGRGRRRRGGSTRTGCGPRPALEGSSGRRVRRWSGSGPAGPGAGPASSPGASGAGRPGRPAGPGRSCGPAGAAAVARGGVSDSMAAELTASWPRSSRFSRVGGPPGPAVEQLWDRQVNPPAASAGTWNGPFPSAGRRPGPGWPTGGSPAGISGIQGVFGALGQKPLFWEAKCGPGNRGGGVRVARQGKTGGGRPRAGPAGRFRRSRVTPGER